MVADSLVKIDNQPTIQLVDHPIVRYYQEEVLHEAASCPADDCDPCEYEAN